MSTLLGMVRSSLLVCLAFGLLALGGCGTMHKMMGSSGSAGGIDVSLNGSQEVPPVTTNASGTGKFTIGDDMSVSGSITTTGIDGKAAHIHTGAAGANGPVSVPLTKSGDSTWSVPPGSKLSSEQFASYKAGNLYVNVHSAAHPGGEIRGQLNPK